MSTVIGSQTFRRSNMAWMWPTKPLMHCFRRPMSPNSKHCRLDFVRTDPRHVRMDHRWPHLAPSCSDRMMRLAQLVMRFQRLVLLRPVSSINCTQ